MEFSTLLSHPHGLLHTANQRWENAKKINYHTLIYASVGVGVSLPAAFISFTGCISSLFLLDEEHPYLQSAAIISGFVVPSIFLVLGVGCELIRRDIKKDILWTIKDVEDFKTILLDVPIEKIDVRTRNIAAMSGVISSENYKSWCTLSQKQKQFDKNKIHSFNISINPTDLFYELNEERKQFMQEKIKLERLWNNLKKTLLADLPSAQLETQELDS